MAWKITLRGESFSSDDMTLAELGEIEQATGKPWSLLNPWTDVKVAREFARVALHRKGLDGEELDAEVSGLTLRDVKSAFDFEPDEPIEESGEAVPLDRSSSSTRSSSRGPRGGTSGDPAKRSKSA